MQSHWANSAPYYRCRFPAEYALANRITHPPNVCLREDAILADVDGWLTREFGPHRLRETIADLVAAEERGAIRPDDHEEIAQKIGACDHKLAQYRAALDAGASPGTVAGWIAETEAERARHEMSLRQSATRARMSEEEIEAMISRLGGLAVTLHDPDPGDKSEVYQQLGLRLTYQPGKRVVRGAISLEAPGHWFSMVWVSEGGLEHTFTGDFPD
jgi:site-specific DNA recombinase